LRRFCYFCLFRNSLAGAQRAGSKPNTATRGFPVLLFKAAPSGCPFSRLRRIPGRSFIQAPDHISRRICYSGLSFTVKPKFPVSYCPVTPLSKHTDELYQLSEHRRPGLLVQASAPILCKPEGLTNRIRLQLSNFHLFHILRATFLRFLDPISSEPSCPLPGLEYQLEVATRCLDFLRTTPSANIFSRSAPAS
jgi:hypothetical protein